MKDLIVQIGQRHNRSAVVLPAYPGPWRVDAQLIAAIIAHLDEKYSGAGWKEFDYVEILRAA